MSVARWECRVIIKSRSVRFGTALPSNLRAIMGISAHAISSADWPLTAIWVTSVRMRRGNGQGHHPISSDRPELRRQMTLDTRRRRSNEKSVWIDFDNAFPRPVTHSEDTIDYVPTQIPAELLPWCAVQVDFPPWSRQRPFCIAGCWHAPSLRCILDQCAVCHLCRAAKERSLHVYSTVLWASATCPWS
jgi:hypothetical protein